MTTGPIEFSARLTNVAFDKPVDDKRFEVPGGKDKSRRQGEDERERPGKDRARRRNGEVEAMSRKVILCRCEDVTLADVAARGRARATRDLEEVKRYTGFGTGPCQGKECLRAGGAARSRRPPGRAPGDARAVHARPPLVPTELDVLARPARRAGAPDDDA